MPIPSGGSTVILPQKTVGLDLAYIPLKIKLRSAQHMAHHMHSNQPTCASNCCAWFVPVSSGAEVGVKFSCCNYKEIRATRWLLDVAAHVAIECGWSGRLMNVAAQDGWWALCACRGFERQIGDGWMEEAGGTGSTASHTEWQVGNKGHREMSSWILTRGVRHSTNPGPVASKPANLVRRQNLEWGTICRQKSKVKHSVQLPKSVCC